MSERSERTSKHSSPATGPAAVSALMFAVVLGLASLAGCGSDRTDDAATLSALQDQVDEVQLLAVEREVEATAASLQELRGAVEQAVADDRLSEGRAAEIVAAADSVEAALTSITTTTTTTTTTTAPPTTTTTAPPDDDDGDGDGDGDDDRKPPKPERPGRDERPGGDDDDD